MRELERQLFSSFPARALQRIGHGFRVSRRGHLRAMQRARDHRDAVEPPDVRIDPDSQVDRVGVRSTARRAVRRRVHRVGRVGEAGGHVEHLGARRASASRVGREFGRG
eukprot:6900897-Prymnesium_polylepis.2